ncbi:MAG: trypsin-like peptidase domain-containing protein [Ezakiella sp.]|nr:trypsin-like peptidase domain-containing protein [Ezakiella sp.]MDD7471295.1 trypsin-like peptidase domain-containing protein [Bacillota bacterium]MDY3923610.1 trypsin-like peptidase domain-containing protein [Ezakiella sp.]
MTDRYDDEYEEYRERRQKEREERLKNLIERRQAYEQKRSDEENEQSNTNYEKPYEPEPKARKKKRNIGNSILTVILCVLLSLGSGYYGSKLYMEKNPIEVSENNAPKDVIKIEPTGDEGVVAVVAKKALPSVVGITTTETVRGFFGLQDLKGVGSGIIVDPNGYILTNSHVVGDGKAKTIEVLLDDNTTVSAKLLWNDASMDLAVIKVEKTNLVAAELADSDKLTIGEKAIAIGNPLGLDFNRSVTAGYISGIGRALTTQDGKTISNLIQTDAAINQGNSGGPLLNAKGEVIGINSAKIGGEGTEGLGFAIPINTAKDILSSLLERGTATPVVVGVQITDYDYYKAYFRIENDYDGVIILQVEPNSTASRAKLMQNDVVLKIDDANIKNTDNFRTALIKYKKGDTATFTVLRNGEEKQIEVQF